jgi:hypothetical protein
MRAYVIVSNIPNHKEYESTKTHPLLLQHTEAVFDQRRKTVSLEGDWNLRHYGVGISFERAQNGVQEYAPAKRSGMVLQRQRELC